MSYSHSFSGRDERDPTIPRFFSDEVKDEDASAKAGRAIYRSIERVELTVPGNTLNKPVMNVTDELRERFRPHYDRWRQGQEMAADGTPLEMWPILTPAQVRELKALSIFTIEHCAALNDQAIQRIGMGGRALKERARAYLDDAERLAIVEQLTREKDIWEAQRASLERQLEELRVLVNQLHQQNQAQMAMPNAVAAYTPQPTPADINAQMRAEYAQAPAASSLDALGAPKKRGRPTNAEIEARRAQEAVA